jgi:hypothetical protein
MSFDKIVAGDKGQVAKLTFVDVDTDAAADISSYSSLINMIFTDPGGNVATKVAAFDSDGTDGVIAYTTVTDDIDEAGHWKVRGKVTAAGGAVLTTEEHTFLVLA